MNVAAVVPERHRGPYDRLTAGVNDLAAEGSAGRGRLRGARRRNTQGAEADQDR